MSEADVSVRAVNDPSGTVPREYLDFLASDRVSPRTREVLQQRLQVPALKPDTLTGPQIETLRAMLARIVPQNEPAIDLTAYVLDRLAGGVDKGDGWRFAVLPVDLEAYRQGLDTLAARNFSSLSGQEQDAILQEFAAAEMNSPEARWFEEVRGDATAVYASHPATLARWGYSGFGVGGAHTPHQGFVQLAPNQREAWEPLPQAKAEPAR